MNCVNTLCYLITSHKTLSDFIDYAYFFFPLVYSQPLVPRENITAWMNAIGLIITALPVSEVHNKDSFLYFWFHICVYLEMYLMDSNLSRRLRQGAHAHKQREMPGILAILLVHFCVGRCLQYGKFRLFSVFFSAFIYFCLFI